MDYQVDSEVGALQQVIVHRPGAEMTRLTPGNMDQLLFDDLLWLEQAQAEHDAFVETLRCGGAEVLQLSELLAETMEVPQAREAVITRALGEHHFGPQGAEVLQHMAQQMTPQELAQLLVAGITRRELLDRVDEPVSLDVMSRGLDDFVLDPLPNHLFTRDTSCWVGDRVQVNAMAMPARRREALNYEAIYRWHPRFAGVGRWGGVWHDEVEALDHGALPDERGALEGGDVLVAGNGAVLVGLSERTVAMGAERLARRLFAAGAATCLVAVHMPRERAQMHLDTVMTMVDEHSFIRYAGFGDRTTWVLRPDGDQVSITRNDPEDFPAVLAEALGVDRVRLLTPPHDPLVAQREQWNDACNVLALAPGVVVGYQRNVLTRRFLAENGIEVVDVPGDELGRGRGGPRCMSCPTRRAPLG
ncbi:arginine deiminase [Luteococcus peritonei]|uniref:Arginine deiminase n=1 Tax=Luteococcus peritonei TaxID=88874 RepID=A0ABW4RZL1_9ACTN